MSLIICLFVCLIVHSFIYSIARSFVRSFIRSFNHENARSIWQLCKLMTEGTEGFQQSQIPPELLKIYLKKSVYPYKYMDDWKKFKKTSLPPKEAFYSKLNETHI
ncbi:hypothetical protein RhiirC2_804833, partial [Rhizophagus irregularis]